MTTKIYISILLFIFITNTSICQDIFKIRDSTALEINASKKSTDNPRLTASVGGGISFVNGKSTDNLHPDDRKFLKQLKFGLNANADILYHLNYNRAIGLKYTQFFSDAGLSMVSVDEDSISIYSHLEAVYSIGLIAPFYRYNIKLSQFSNICIDMGIGYMFAKEVINLRSDVLADNFEAKNNIIGVFAGIAYEVWPQDFWAIALRLDLVTGVSSNFEHSFINKTFQQESIKLSRIDLGLELRFVL